METIELKQIANADHLLRTSPPADHGARLIARDSKLTVDGECVGLYVNCDTACLSDLRRVARETKLAYSHRFNSGIPTASSVFGAVPRSPFRKDFCRFTRASANEPNNFISSFQFSEKIAALYKEHLPEAFAFNMKLIRENVASDWLPNSTPFTTCNFNVNHAIKYHRDTGNFKGVFSNVLILKEGVKGGQLVFPELGIAFEQTDGALGIFDGQKWIHGVTALQQIKRNGYRASIVYYALAGMKHCYPYKEEIARYKKLRVDKERESSKGNPKLRRLLGRVND